jgi:hypothetical protein
MGQIAKDSMSEEEQSEAIANYVANYIAPTWLGTGREKAVHAIQGRPMKLGQEAPTVKEVAIQNLLGLSTVKSSSSSTKKTIMWKAMNLQKGVRDRMLKVQLGEMSMEEAKRLTNKQMDEFREYAATHK